MACESWACFRSVRSYNRVYALPDHRTLASIFIFFTNFFLITVSNRFCALLSIRAALLIGSRCVVVFAIFFLSFISRCRKSNTLSAAVGDAFKVPVYGVSGRSIPNTSYRGNDRRATGLVRAFTELASVPCSSFIYSMTDWGRAAIDWASQTRSNCEWGKSQLAVVGSRSFALRASAGLQSHLPSPPWIPKCSSYECRQNRQSRQHASTDYQSVQSPIRPLAGGFHTFRW